MSDQYAPPAGPPPSYHSRQTTSQHEDASLQHHVQWAPSGNRERELASNNPFRDAYRNTTQVLHPSSSDQPPQYQPSPGPPPRWTGEKAPHRDDDYAPPSGPPPNWSDEKRALPNDDYEPPSGPPPSRKANEAEPPPYDPWLAIPDNALLPPPPSIKEERSPTANASYDDAARAHAWCRENPLWQPRPLNQQTLQRISAGHVNLTSPPNSTRHASLHQSSPGTTHVRTNSKCPDSIFLSDIPLYAASTRTPQTIYYELRVISMGGHHHGAEEADAGIAIGFVAPPYPSWRLPGWHRASLAVHGDDGRRYVDNSYGGQDFTSAFRPGDIVGIGVNFSPPSYAGGKPRCEVFFTRNGRKDGAWDLDEERDQEQEEGDVRGLQGECDILAAVGCFGAVEFEVRCRREEWVFRP